MYLVGGDRRSPEQCESYMSKGTPLRGSGGPILALHHAVVRGRSAESNSIPKVIGAHASEGTASGHPSFEMVNV